MSSFRKHKDTDFKFSSFPSFPMATKIKIGLKLKRRSCHGLTGMKKCDYYAKLWRYFHVTLQPIISATWNYIVIILSQFKISNICVYKWPFPIFVFIHLMSRLVPLLWCVWSSISLWVETLTLNSAFWTWLRGPEYDWRQSLLLRSLWFNQSIVFSIRRQIL